MRHLLVTLSLALVAQLAQAAEAGKVIFVAGNATLADRPATEGARVQEGDMLGTGADGFIYVKTVDNGLFILRPHTKARIAAYHVDAKDPANTRIKLELLSGVARSKSGEAVKLARQNFRFNTPVAAIGVRGTDFTVFTDNDTSRVAVFSGGIVMSGFAGACRPEGTGPCEGNASRELSGSQRGQLLQVQRGQVAPQLLQGGALGPDQLAPPRGDEPIGKTGGVNSAPTLVTSLEPNLDAKKSEGLGQLAGPGIPVTPPAPPVVIPPPVVPVVPEVPEVPKLPEVPVVQLPERQIVWGRWQPLLGKEAKLDFVTEKAKSELLGVNGNFVLFLTPGKDYVAPSSGSMGFALLDSEAYIYKDEGSVRTVTPASLKNGQLNIDFGKRTFGTSMDMVDGSALVKLQAQGAVTSNGRLFGDSALGRSGYMNVTGALSNESGGSAAYLFDARLDVNRTANGVTYWRK